MAQTTSARLVDGTAIQAGGTRVLALTLTLDSPTPAQAISARLVVGTAIQAGEDNVCGGRLLILDVGQAGAPASSAGQTGAPAAAEGSSSGGSIPPAVVGAPGSTDTAGGPSGGGGADTGGGAGARQLTLLFEHEERGPITAVATLQGMLLCAVGQKIAIWSCRNGDLRPAGFHYAGALPHPFPTNSIPPLLPHPPD
jgi:hypothetical protein